MPQIIAWQCATTKTLFDDQGEYKKHLRKLAIANRKIKAEKKLRTDFDDWLRDEKSKITSPEQIAPWIIKNQKYLMDSANAMGYNSFSDKFFNTDTYEKIDIFSLRYDRLVSNSHSCPKGGVTNWWSTRDTGKPVGYPGWTGDITGSLKRLAKHNGNYPYDSILKLVGIHTGTGGGANNSWRFDIKIFLADWPGLQTAVDEMEMDAIARKLKGIR